MTLEELNKMFRDLIRDELSLSEVIAYYPNAPRPDDDYCSINIADLIFVGNGDQGYVPNSDDLTEKVTLQYEAMVSINFFRENARQNAGMFASVIRSQSATDIFNANGVGFIRQSSVRDLNIKIDQGYEERGQVDVYVYFELTPVPPKTVTGIDTARVVGDIDNSSEIIESIDISIGG